MYMYLCMAYLASPKYMTVAGQMKGFTVLLLFTLTVTISDRSLGLGGAAPTLEVGLVPDSD